MVWNHRKLFLNFFKDKDLTDLLNSFYKYVLLSIFTLPKAHLRHLIHKIKWGAAAPNPYEVLYVKTDDIKYVTTSDFPYIKSKDGTYIKGGCWDRRKRESKEVLDAFDENNEEIMELVKIKNYMLIKSIINYIKYDVCWKKTNFYLNGLNQRSKNYLEKRKKNIDRLNNQIQKYGFKSQRQLNIINGRTKPRPFRPPEWDEILVLIGRNGEVFLENGGRHRFSIAKANDIKKIPVRVLVRHKNWQEKRNKIAKNYQNNQSIKRVGLLSHTDIQNMIKNIKKK